MALKSKKVPQNPDLNSYKYFFKASDVSYDEIKLVLSEVAVLNW